MQRELDLARGGPAARSPAHPRPGLAGRAAILLSRIGGTKSAAQAPQPLPLTEAERRHYGEADFVVDAEGAETFRGLSRGESIDYIGLHRIGLDNDDTAFLRLIALGDRHAACMRLIDRR